MNINILLPPDYKGCRYLISRFRHYRPVPRLVSMNDITRAIQATENGKNVLNE